MPKSMDPNITIIKGEHCIYDMAKKNISLRKLRKPKRILTIYLIIYQFEETEKTYKNSYNTSNYISV